VSLSQAQSLSTYLDKDTIEVGESVRLIFSLEQDYPIDTFYMERYQNIFPGREMTYNQEGEQLTASHELEIYAAKDTFFEANGQFNFKRIYDLTGWDSARVIIPPQTISFPDSNFLFPPVMVEVTMPRADPSADIYDINELFTEAPSEKDSWMTYLKWAWIPIVLVALLVFFLIKRKKKVVTVAEKSLRERTLIAIEELLNSKSYEEDLKDYYVQLSLILRSFLAENYNMSFREKTTREIMMMLNKLGVTFDTRKEIEMILGQSDLVKYAKSKPPIADVFIITEKAKTIVEELAPIELPEINE
jgi:hypothetical protein